MFESIHVLCTLPEMVSITRTQTHVTSVCHFTSTAMIKWQPEVELRLSVHANNLDSSLSLRRVPKPQPDKLRK